MSYNKAKAEKEWLKWKEAEEKKLRDLGVEEDTIQRLHTYDWEQFKSERRFLERWEEWSPYADQLSAQELKIPEEDEEKLLDSLEDEKLLRHILKADKLTLKIAFLRMEGYDSQEIAQYLDLTPNAVNLRMYRLKQKIKKFFKRKILACPGGYIVKGRKQVPSLVA